MNRKPKVWSEGRIRAIRNALTLSVAARLSAAADGHEETAVGELSIQYGVCKSGRAHCAACGERISGVERALRVTDASGAGGLWTANQRWMHMRDCTAEEG